MSLIEHISQPVDDLGFDPRRAGLQRQELAAAYRKQYDQKLRRARLVAHLIIGLGLVIFLGSWLALSGVQGGRVTGLASTSAIIGFLIAAVGKLGLWISSMKISALRAIKELELQVADLADAIHSQAGATQPSQEPPTSRPQG